MFSHTLMATPDPYQPGSSQLEFAATSVAAFPARSRVVVTSSGMFGDMQATPRWLVGAGVLHVRGRMGYRFRAAGASPRTLRWPILRLGQHTFKRSLSIGRSAIRGPTAVGCYGLAPGTEMSPGLLQMPGCHQACAKCSEGWPQPVLQRNHGRKRSPMEPGTGVAGLDVALI